MDKLSLINLNNGACVEIFDRDLQAIMDNIKDINTDAESARSITLTVTFKPNPDRTGAVAVVDSKVRVAGVKANRGSIFIINDKGKPVGYPKDPRQDVLFGDQSSGPSKQ